MKLVLMCIIAFMICWYAAPDHKVRLYKDHDSEGNTIATFESKDMHGFNLAFSNCESMVEAIKKAYPNSNEYFECAIDR